jgi:hypothetical protein
MDQDSLSNGNVYLDEATDRFKEASMSRAVEAAGCEAIEKIKGMASCFKRSDLLSGSTAICACPE